MINLLLLGCSDNMIAYPVEKESEGNIIEDTATYDVVATTPDIQQEDEHVEEVQEPIDEEPVEDTGYEDTGSYEEVIEDPETEESTGETDEEEPEEIIEEATEEVTVDENPCDDDTSSEVEEEVIEEEITTPSNTDNFNYDDSYVVHSHHVTPSAVYAEDMGWTMINHSGADICGLQPSGYIDCQCTIPGESHPWYPGASSIACSVGNLTDVIPFETFEDLHLTNDAICATRSDGTTSCYHEDETVYSPPTSSTVDIVVLSVGSDNDANTICTLEDTGYLFCFDTVTGGMVHSDTNTYKVIEGGGSWVCGVHTSGLELTCHKLTSTYDVYNIDLTNSEYQEIIGFDSDNNSYCMTLLDANNMEEVQCVSAPFGNSHYNCLQSAPHQYYYDFFTNDADLSNVKVSSNGAVGMVYTDYGNTTHENEIQWGGFTGPNSHQVNNGYYTGAGCNYYWGN